jgi:hypothetical protein
MLNLLHSNNSRKLADLLEEELNELSVNGHRGDTHNAKSMDTDTDNDNDNENDNEDRSSGGLVTSKESWERECEDEGARRGVGEGEGGGEGRSGSSCSESGSGRARSHSGSSGDSAAAALVRCSRKVRRMGDESAAATRSQYSCADYGDEVDADADADAVDERRLPQTSSRSGSPHLLGHRGARFDDAKSWATGADSRSVQVVGLVQGQQRECRLSCHAEFEARAGEEKVSAACCTVVTSPNQPASLQSCSITNFESVTSCLIAITMLFFLLPHLQTQVQFI